MLKTWPRPSMVKNQLSVNKNHKNLILRYTDEKPFNCEVCCIAFTRKFDLNTHKRTHTSVKLYECEVCGKAFSRILVDTQGSILAKNYSNVKFEVKDLRLVMESC